MTIMTFVEANGERYVVEAADGASLCEVALEHGVAGVMGDCGGNCACGTCHGYIVSAMLPAPLEDELAMLEGTPNTNAHSRLLCQLRVGPGTDGLVITLPASQY